MNLTNNYQQLLTLRKKKILTEIVAGAPKTPDPKGLSKRFWPPTFSGSVKTRHLLKQNTNRDVDSHFNTRQTQDRKQLNLPSHHF